MEARMGIEPMIRALQSPPLPLGYRAQIRFAFRPGCLARGFKFSENPASTKASRMAYKNKNRSTEAFLASGRFTELWNLRVTLVRFLRQKAHKYTRNRNNMPSG